jgi:hypothetical protein
MNKDLIINETTGEIISTDIFRQTKIKALSLLKPTDFVMINGTWEATRDALIKILSSLPISYSWEIKQKELTDTFASITGVLNIEVDGITRRSDGIGICELNELRGTKSLHFMITRAETRALKRAIEVLFGSVINYYVVKYLV